MCAPSFLVQSRKLATKPQQRLFSNNKNIDNIIWRKYKWQKITNATVNNLFTFITIADDRERKKLISTKHYKATRNDHWSVCSSVPMNWIINWMNFDRAKVIKKKAKGKWFVEFICQMERYWNKYTLELNLKQTIKNLAIRLFSMFSEHISTYIYHIQFLRIFHIVHFRIDDSICMIFR